MNSWENLLSSQQGWINPELHYDGTGINGFQKCACASLTAHALFLQIQTKTAVIIGILAMPCSERKNHKMAHILYHLKTKNFRLS